MEQIIIGFSKSSKRFAPFSWLIMWAESVPYSHVYMKFYSKSLDENIIYQASHTMVNFMNESNFDAEENVIQEFQFQISSELRNKIMKFCVQNSAKPYGTLSILGLVYVQAAGWLGFKVINPVNDNENSFFCSELISTMLKQCTTVKIVGDLDSITPKDIYQIVSTLPKTLS